LLIESKTIEKTLHSNIFAIEGTNGNDEGFKQLLTLMSEKNFKFFRSSKKTKFSGSEGLIDSEDVIILKINSQWDERGGTNTDLIKSLIVEIAEHPDGFRGEVVIADNGQAQYGSTGHGGSLDYQNNNAQDLNQSMNSIVKLFDKRLRVSSYLWDSITEKIVGEYFDGNEEDGYVVSTRVNPLTNVLVSYPKFRTIYGSKISFKYGVWDPEKNEYNSNRLKIINIPVLKCHFIFGVTGALKHYMGVPSDKISAKLGYRIHSTVGRGGMGTLMANTRVPVLNILDAIYVNAKPGTGPKTTYSNAINAKIIAASSDPVALDYWASKNILCELAKKHYNIDTSSINPDNYLKGSFGSWLKLAANELNENGIPVTHNESNIQINYKKINDLKQN